MPPRARALALAVLAACACLAGGPSAAHPHAWIDVESRLSLDAEGRVVGIVEEWLFDEFYTAFITDGVDRDPAKLQPALEALARRNLGNLKEYGYFTDLRVGDRRLDWAEATDVATGLRGERLWLRFTLPLREPAPARGRWLAYAIYDPSYFVEMLHTEGSRPALETPAGLACAATLTPPSPSPEKQSLAAALDRTQNAGESLGVHFAEWVTVRCE
jgi:ABC-type uncharacterized transport system substrate-binding protein